ncbi:MAG: lytic transglycosylase domain-containing protein [Prolixibacteraceae bacterium]
MKKIFNRLLLTLIFAGVLLGGFYFFGASTLPQGKAGKEPEGEERYYSSPLMPDMLSFAGEPVPLNYFDVRESLERELLVNSYFHSQTLRFLKLAPRYFAVIEPLLAKDSIPDDFKYLALAESGFNSRAVSPAGAVGFWQFLKGTATDYGLEVTGEVDERYHLELSTHAVARYLKDSFRKYGSWSLVAASYNAGRRFVDRQISTQKESSYFDLMLGEETERYVFRILALKLILENPEAYGFQVAEGEKYPLWRTKNVQVSTAVPDFALFAKEHDTNYKILKMLNPWLRESFLTNAKGKTYTIKIPDKDFRTLKK